MNFPRKKSPALCVVHMDEHHSQHYSYGSMEDGIAKLKYVIIEARNHNAPVIFLQLSAQEETRRELSDGLDAYSTVIVPDTNAFNYVPKYNENEKKYCPEYTMQEFLERLLVTDVVLAGINRTCCVLDTAKGAVKSGFAVHTTDEILFDSGHDSKEENEDALKRLHEIGRVYTSAEELVKRVFTN